MYYKWNLIPSRKRVAHKLPGTEDGLLGPKRVPRPLLEQDSSCSNRQRHGGSLHKQERRHEVGLTVWPSMENSDPQFQKPGYSQSLTHSRQAECGSRQVIQASPDHLDRVVSLSRGLPVNVQQVAFGRRIC